MSVVAEDLQLEREPQYNREKIIPEAQLLERPLDIINGLQEAAHEGIVPQVADAISLAHLPSPGFKITHEFNPNAQIEPNDGKAAIVAGICGVTRSCEDRCCPIGDLDKARVRVGLINDLKLNDPNFFNNPNAEKIIKERVNEIMEQKQSITTTGESMNTTPSSLVQANNSSKEKSADAPSAEQKKTKVEIPTGFFGRQLSPEEAKQRMEELSGTYSQGKKIKSAEAPLTTQKSETPKLEKPIINTSEPAVTQIERPTKAEPIDTFEQKPKIPAHIRDMMQARMKRPIESAPPQMEPPQKPVEKSVSNDQPIIEQKATIPQSEVIPITLKPTEGIQTTQPLRPEVIPPTIPQQRIERHRSKLEAPKQPAEQTVSKQPTSETPKKMQDTEKPPVIETPAIQQAVSKPEISQKRDKPQSVDIKTTIVQTQSAPLQEYNFNQEKIVNTFQSKNAVIQQTESLNPKTNTPAEQTIQPEPPIIQLDSDMPLQQKEINTIQFELPEPKQKIDTQLNESVMQIPQIQEMDQSEPQQVQPLVHESNVLQTKTRQTDDKTIVFQPTEQVIPIPNLEIPQTSQKNVIPEMSTIRFVQNTVVSENGVVDFSLESIQIEQRLPEIVSTSGQEIQQKLEIALETPVIRTETSPIIEECNTESTPVNDAMVHSEVPPARIYVESPQNPHIDIHEAPQTISINLQELQKQVAVEEITSGQIKMPTQQVELQAAIADSLHKSMNETDEIIENQEPQIGSEEIMEAPETPIDETNFTEDSQVMISDELINDDTSETIQLEAIREPNIFTENKLPEIPELPDISINQEFVASELTKKSMRISVEAMQGELPAIIAETLSETKIEGKPILVLAIPENNNIIGPLMETIPPEPSEQLVENSDETQEIPQPETFTLQLLDQEQVVNFMDVIQAITGLLSFLHENNQVDDSMIDINNVKEMDVTPEELKNDTFGKYDDTVVATLFPIIQFMLFIQGMQIFIPKKRNAQLTTVA